MDYRLLSYRTTYKAKRFVNYLLFQAFYRFYYRKHMHHKGIYRIQNYRPSSIRFMRDDKTFKPLSSCGLLSENSIVMDVGADTGIWVRQIDRKYNPFFYLFEPNPVSIQTLKKNFSGPKYKIYEYGLGAENTKIMLSIDGMGSSTCTVSPNYMESEKTEIELRDVYAVFKELQLETIDLIKINIEGGEYDLLIRMLETGIVEKCKVIRVQFHEWYPDAYRLKRKISKSLKNTHRMEWNYEFVWESWIRKDIKTPQ